MPKEAGLVLLAVQVLDSGMGMAVLAGMFAQLGKVGVAGHGQQGAFRARRLGLGLGDLLGLRQGDVAGQEGGPGVGTLLEPVGRFEGAASLSASNTSLLR
jgi:hypothetical protein